MTTRPKGCAATHANHPDVRAALTALEDIQLADTTDFFGFDGSTGATGALVQPADDGQVVIYWQEGGSHRSPDGTPFTAELKAVADKLREAGWKVEPRSKVRLSARRPAMATRPSISMYATDDEQRTFVRALTDDDLVWWYEQQEQGAAHAQLTADRDSHDRGAAIARMELQHRANTLADNATVLIADLRTA